MCPPVIQGSKKLGSIRVKVRVLLVLEFRFGGVARVITLGGGAR